MQLTALENKSLFNHLNKTRAVCTKVTILAYAMFTILALYTNANFRLC